MQNLPLRQTSRRDSTTAKANSRTERTVDAFRKFLRTRFKAASSLAEEIEILRLSPLLDPVWYRQSYQDLRHVPVDVARHYLEHGAAEGRNPGPSFDTKLYLEQNPDVAASGINPLIHFIRSASTQGRHVDACSPDPGSPGTSELPPVDAAELNEHHLEVIGGEFDRKFYSLQLAAKRIDRGSRDEIAHYLIWGAALGLDPAPWFSTVDYLADHRDVAANNVNPFYHYLVQGRRESRAVAASRVVRNRDNAVSSSLADSLAGEIAVAKDHFDSKFYLASNIDVARAAIDPLKHFLTTGWREGRNPSPFFSTSDYLEQNPDVAAAGINPLIHYIHAGKAEGRLATPKLGFRYRLLRSPASLEAKVEEAHNLVVERPASARTLEKALRKLTRSNAQSLFCSVSHDDYAHNFGGVQLCLGIEADALAARGIDHIHLFPARPLSVIEADKNSHLIGVRVNGDLAGVFTFAVIAEEFRTHSMARRCMFGVHSLIGHNVENISELLSLLHAERGVYWVHDYSSICSSYNLLRNDVQFCGAPERTSRACMVCRYRKLREFQHEAHEKFFRNHAAQVVAPSIAAAEIWQNVYGRGKDVAVQPHCSLSLRERRAPSGTARGLPLRIAFLGLPVSHKGWWVFRDLVVRYFGDARYEFHHFGANTEPGLPLSFHEVTVTREDLDKMTKVIREYEIDVALIWSLWPETFCLTAFEATAAGAAIITHSDSGNVRALVEAGHSGFVLDSEIDLVAGLDDGRFLSLHRDRRTVSFYDRAFSAMSDEILFSRPIAADHQSA